MWRACSAACLRLQRRVADAVAATGALRAGERALLLLSGGADSMALLSCVRAADRRLELGLQFAALHVDYGLRGADSDRDRRIVERACREAGLPLHVERLRGRLAGRDFQARARAQRYGLARELAAAHAYDVLVTAHNRDDQAETILYRLTKYASPRGLAGMRPRDGDLSRPLLGLGAAEIREYCRAAGIEYGEDVTNAAPLYARNVLRLEVLPRLEALNPRVAETLAAAAEQAAAEADVLAAASAEAGRRVLLRPAPGRSRRRRPRRARRRAGRPPRARPARPPPRGDGRRCAGGAPPRRRASEPRASARTTPAASASAAASRRCAAAARCGSAPSPQPTRARRRSWRARPWSRPARPG